MTGDYGVFLRNNGATALLMQTAKGDPDGVWNAFLRHGLVAV